MVNLPSSPLCPPPHLSFPPLSLHLSLLSLHLFLSLGLSTLSSFLFLSSFLHIPLLFSFILSFLPCLFLLSHLAPSLSLLSFLSSPLFFVLSSSCHSLPFPLSGHRSPLRVGWRSLCSLLNIHSRRECVHLCLCDGLDI